MEKLYQAAFEALQQSYSPYSQFKVGASILLADGNIITGTNVENASYGLSNCAERTALFTAYAQGYRQEDIKKMLVIANTKDPVSPCGACRQVFVELLLPTTEVILTNLNKDTRVFTVAELMPYSFSSEDLT